MLGALLAVQAAGNIVGGIGQYRQSRNEAKALKAQAEEMARRAEHNIANRDIVGKGERSMITQKVASSGFGGAESSLSLLTASLEKQLADIENIRRDAQWEVNNLNTQSANVKKAGNWALAGSILGAAAQGMQTKYAYNPHKGNLNATNKIG